MRSARIPLLVIYLASLAGCSSATAPTRCTDDPIHVAVSSPHATPTFTWSAACPVQLLEVTYTDSTSTVVHVWYIGDTTGADGIASPVTYGQVPGSIEELVAPAPLDVGRPYSVHLIGTDFTHSNAGFIGLGTFVH